MRVLVAISPTTANLLWARSAPTEEYPNPIRAKLEDGGEVDLISLHEDTVIKIFDLYDDDDFDDALRRVLQLPDMG
jgi:hypothetical protein